MQLAALEHVARAPMAYPVGEEHLRVILKAAAGDLARAVCVYGDRYTPMENDQPAEMKRLGSDGISDYWGVTLQLSSKRFRYLIYVEGQDGERAWLGETGVQRRKPKSGVFQYAYIHRNDRWQQPDWVGGSVFYQIFPDRFFNGDPTNDPPNKMKWGDKPTPSSMAGGDLAGIEQKLDYLKDLGIGCIYTTPIFKSPTNHKYDTTDYYQIDPTFGTNEQFRSLVAKAHEYGMKFLLDAVFNHSGAQWAPFRDVIEKGEQSEYRDWFYNLHSFPVSTKEINYETFAWNVASMPKLNTGNPALKAYLLDVAAHWIREYDIDGWRLDVANEIDHDFWRDFRKTVKGAKPNAWILGEIWHNSFDWLQGDQYDSVMNYPWREATLSFLRGQLDPIEYDQELTKIRYWYTAEAHRGLLNLLGSHDAARVRTELAGSREKAAQAAVLLLTAESVPLIYYGDEIGMEGATDPDCRRCYPWDEPEQQDAEMLALYKKLIAIRNARPWLNYGDWETIEADPVTGVYGYRRVPRKAEFRTVEAEAKDGLWVYLNTSNHPQTVELWADCELVDLLDGTLKAGQVEAGNKLFLPAHGFAVLAPVGEK
jgi:cyclomaltodextrinase